jgi:Arylsulfotransferase (ASST)
MFVRSGIRESRASRRRLLWLGAVPVLLCALALLSFSGATRADAPAVDVFPIPGAHYASPQTQIAFRGISPDQVGSISVTGSRSGAHSGTVKADSDGRGESFLPSAPFTPGEVVTVQTSLNVQGANNGTFTFTVATPAGIPRPFHWPAAGRTGGDVQTYRSRRDLVPPAIQILTRQRGAAPGDLFLSSQYGPVQDGPLIVDPYGTVLWFKPLSGDNSASDFREQTYQGQPVLTWWQGYASAGVGIGEGVINNSSYQQIATVQAANGLKMDLHEFQITPQNTALITSEYPVIVNATSVHGPSRQVVFDSVVQEIDIPTGLVLFQWDSLDHVPLSATFAPLPKQWWVYFDYFHVNSVAIDDDGALIISARNTWAAYKVSHQTGAMIWQLGGRHSSFKLAPGTYWAFQHDVRPRARNDQYMTLFDDSAGPPTVHSQSRAVKLQLNLKNMTAHQVQALSHSPAISTNYEGNDQQLPNFDQFVGWGQQPYFTEYSPSGRVVFDARFVDFSASYRAYRFQWSGTPTTIPAIAASRRGSQMTVYASWNGATHIKSWRVLGGSSPTSLHPLTTARKGGFETAITTRAQNYVEVVPLDYSGHVLGRSAAIKS